MDAQTRGMAPSVFIPPDISHPVDVEYTEGQTGNIISWSIDGAGTGGWAYYINRNGTLVASGSWSDPGTITYPVDGLSPGVYEILLHASDNFGYVEDVVLVTVSAAQNNLDWMAWTAVISVAGIAALVVFKAFKLQLIR
ncbi:MAG: hypothetical protein JW839_01275 [Candidatus Lokiarchaeota archaeon]|nr:hypothetical protein [Candidatus Lokiarchaeota archaeon]